MSLPSHRRGKKGFCQKLVDDLTFVIVMRYRYADVMHQLICNVAWEERVMLLLIGQFRIAK